MPRVFQNCTGFIDILVVYSYALICGAAEVWRATVKAL